MKLIFILVIKKTISAGCQTGPSGKGSYPRYLKFIKKAHNANFKDNYYLRGKN